MTRSRYQSLGVEQHGGRTVVVLHDSIEDTTQRVYKRGQSWLQLKDDRPLRSDTAKRAAREALEETS